MIFRRGTLACLVAALTLGGCTFFTLPDFKVELVSVELTAPALFPAGVDAQLSATGTFNDGSVRDLTANVTWTSLAPPA